MCVCALACWQCHGRVYGTVSCVSQRIVCVCVCARAFCLCVRASCGDVVRWEGRHASAEEVRYRASNPTTGTHTTKVLLKNTGSIMTRMLPSSLQVHVAEACSEHFGGAVSSNASPLALRKWKSIYSESAKRLRAQQPHSPRGVSTNTTKPTPTRCAHAGKSG